MHKSLMKKAGAAVMAAAMAAGCCISHEKINMSALPMAFQASFQPFSLHLAYPGSTNREDSVNSKMIGCVSWISNTSLDTMNLVFVVFFNIEF